MAGMAARTCGTCVPSYQALNSASLASSTGLAQAMNIDFAIGAPMGLLIDYLTRVDLCVTLTPGTGLGQRRHVRERALMAAQPDAANGSGGQGHACVDVQPAESGGVGAAQRYAWLEHLLPPVEEVRPGLWSIPVPWPRSGLRYTLSYLVSGRGGLALIDTGWPTEEAWSALADSVTQTRHDIAELRYGLVTPAHADHLGLAGRVREASGALVGMHPAESATLLHRVEPQAWQERLSGWLRSRGAPDDQLAEITDVMAGAVAFHARLARSDFDVEHDSLPLGAGTGLRAVWTPGHTPGHLCFYDEQHDGLLTGDHVLPRITPHIGLAPGAEGDPLGDYEASLRALARYNPAEVLPAHEYR